MLDEIKAAVIAGDAERTVELVEQALAQGANPQQIVDDALTAGLWEVGDRFDKGEYFIPEMLIGADAMEQAMVILKPLLSADAADATGTVVMGTIKGDLHDIGKNLVITMLESAGFDVIELGVDVPIPTYLEAAAEHDADIVAIGALLTTALPAMEEATRAIKALDSAPLVMIGGAAVTTETKERFGADGYAPNAKQAADLAVGLIGGGNPKAPMS